VFFLIPAFTLCSMLSPSEKFLYNMMQWVQWLYCCWNSLQNCGLWLGWWVFLNC